LDANCSVGIEALRVETSPPSFLTELRLAEPKLTERRLVPHAGVEPALLSKLDFESSASTNSANGATDTDEAGV
jgi:hypothetical protein